MADVTIPIIYPSPSTRLQHLALATHDDPVVNLDSAPPVVGGAGDNAQVDEPPAKIAKVII